MVSFICKTCFVENFICYFYIRRGTSTLGGRQTLVACLRVPNSSHVTRRSQGLWDQSWQDFRKKREENRIHKYPRSPRRILTSCRR